MAVRCAQFWRNSGAILRNYSDTASCSDLFDRIERLGPFAEEHAAALTAQVAAAVAYLHEKRIVHRDLKPDNLVFESSLPDSPIKLIDFGYAGLCGPEASLVGLCGTPDYAAPEILSWYTARNSGAIHAQFGRNSGAII